MKQSQTAGLILLLLLSASLAEPGQAQRRKNQRVDNEQYYRPPSSFAGKSVLIPIGTTFEGRIDSTISSSKSQAGLRFTIIMSSPVLANGSEVIIPAGAQMIAEVVEAIPASSLPRQKGMAPPRGKLRVQITGLRMPDGTTYPLVASLAGEVSGRSGHQSTPLGTGVAYVGSSTSFESVGPGARGSRRPDGRSPVVSKQEMLKNELYGLDRTNKQDQGAQIRSLTLRNRDYYIYSGSPLTIRLNAPLKITVSSGNNVSESMNMESTRQPEIKPEKNNSPRPSANDF